MIKLEPLGTYYGRCKVRRKLVRKSFKTKTFEVAKAKLKTWLRDVGGQVNTREGSMADLVEAYTRKLRLDVDSRDIRERTMSTKLECLTQIQKVWEERFGTGKIDPQNYA